MSKEYGAFVTVRYWCPNMCSDTDASEGETVEDIIRWVIESEGVLGVCEDMGTVVSIEPVEELA